MKTNLTTTRRVVRLSDDATREIEAERRAHLSKRRRNRAAVAAGYQVAAVLPSRTATAPTFN